MVLLSAQAAAGRPISSPPYGTVVVSYVHYYCKYIRQRGVRGERERRRWRIMAQNLFSCTCTFFYMLILRVELFCLPLLRGSLSISTYGEAVCSPGAAQVARSTVAGIILPAQPLEKLGVLYWYTNHTSRRRSKSNGK